MEKIEQIKNQINNTSIGKDFINAVPVTNIWKEISISNLEHNLEVIKKRIGNNVQVLAIVKADSYGHSAVSVSKILRKKNVSYFGVASLIEAIQLRNKNIKSNIIILGQVLENEIPYLFEYDLISSISSFQYASSLDNYCKNYNKTINVHIKIDTGMGRFGIEVSKALPLIDFLLRGKRIFIQGIFSHFATSDNDLNFANIQLDRFKKLINDLEKQEIYIPLKHIANSSGIFNLNDSFFNMVRPGLSLYGYCLNPLNDKLLKPVMQLKTKLVFKKDISKGQSISYGQTFISDKQMVMGIIPIGYSHGLDRALSNIGEVLIAGERAKIIGRICMDYTMIDITDQKDRVNLGDEVVIIGTQDKEEIKIEEICSKTNRIPYEILCGINSKVHKSIV